MLYNPRHGNQVDQWELCFTPNHFDSINSGNLIHTSCICPNRWRVKLSSNQATRPPSFTRIWNSDLKHCFFTALVTVPLGEAVAIFFVAPLMITALSVFIIREEVGLSSWIAVLVGLLGVLIILRPGFEEFNPGYILPLVAALAYALVQIITGKMGEKEKASSMAFYIQLIFIVVCSLFGLFFGDGHLADPSQPIINYLFRPWTIPSWGDGMIMIGIGLLSGVGAYFISQAYRISKGAVVAPFEYVALPLAIFWSITLFGDWPDMASWMGIVLIAGAGIFNVFSEKIQARTIVLNRPMPRNR